MKHLVLIAGLYYPDPSPTGKCAMQYIELLKEEYEIDVIYIQSGLKKIYEKYINGVTLYGLSNWRLLIETWFHEQYKKTPNKVLQRIYNAGVLIMKAIGRIQSMVFFPNNLRWFYKKAFRALKNIHLIKPIDVVFTVNSPFSAHLAGEAFKKMYPNVRWVTYTVDPFYVGNSVGKKKSIANTNKDLYSEKHVLSFADVNFLSEEVYENSISLFEHIKYKTFPLPYLLPKNNGYVDDMLFDNNKINLVYAGRFYKDIRNPEFLLKTFLNIKHKGIILHLYAASDCEDLINQYVEQSSGTIVRHDLVNQEEVQKILNSADILINVGNSIPEFKPSKVFEYVVTGKPIINLYQNNLKDDLLEHHLYALQISIDTEPRHASFEIQRFILNNKGKKMDSTMIDSMFERHSVNNIRNILIAGVE